MLSAPAEKVSDHLLPGFDRIRTIEQPEATVLETCGGSQPQTGQKHFSGTEPVVDRSDRGSDLGRDTRDRRPWGATAHHGPKGPVKDLVVSELCRSGHGSLIE